MSHIDVTPSIDSRTLFLTLGGVARWIHNGNELDATCLYALDLTYADFLASANEQDSCLRRYFPDKFYADWKLLLLNDSLDDAAAEVPPRVIWPRQAVSNAARSSARDEFMASHGYPPLRTLGKPRLDGMPHVPHLHIVFS